MSGDTLEDIYHVLLELVRRYNKSREDPEALANDFWLQFVHGDYEEIMKGFERMPFLRAFVKKRCMGALTKEGTHDKYEGLEYCWERSGPGDPVSDLLGKELKEEGAEILARLEEELDDEDRLLVRLLIERKKRREMQKELGCSIGTVHNRIERLRARPEIEELRLLLGYREKKWLRRVQERKEDDHGS